MKISENALKVLGAMSVEQLTEGGDAIARITGGQLDRKLYVEVNKVLELLGGKWNRKQAGHVFTGEDDIAAQLDAVCTTGEIVDRKKLYQFFETPRDLADKVVELARIEPYMAVLEPSAGSGALLHAIARTGILTANVAVELDRKHEKSLNALANLDDESLYIGHDFMAFAVMDRWQFDRVVMNPPFTRQQDAQHIAAAYTLLKPGGRLVAVASAAVKFRDTEAYRWVRQHATEIIDNPEGTFKASGTNVNTVIVVIDK